MPMELLRQLAQEDHFPTAVEEEADIDKLRILAAAGMVQAVFPKEAGQAARIVAITGMGRATLLAQTAREVIDQRKRMRGQLPSSLEF